MEEIKLMFDEETLRRYEEECYFVKHPRATKKPLQNPYQESMNVWMIMKRPQMNALKQKWKDFMVWFIEDQGYTNLHIAKCEMTYTVYKPTRRRLDLDNNSPKFLQDGIVESGLIDDDDMNHITSLTLRGGYDPEHPRTEILITNIELKENNNG